MRKRSVNTALLALGLGIVPACSQEHAPESLHTTPRVESEAPTVIAETPTEVVDRLWRDGIVKLRAEIENGTAKLFPTKGCVGWESYAGFTIVVNPAQYTISEGETIVTFFPFLAKNEAGEYLLMNGAATALLPDGKLIGAPFVIGSDSFIVDDNETMVTAVGEDGIKLAGDEEAMYSVTHFITAEDIQNSKNIPEGCSAELLAKLLRTDESV